MEMLSDKNDAVIAVRAPNSAIASLPLPGPLRNPGFEGVPWQPRTETTKSGLGMYCPSHLHQFTEDEMAPAHYPNAAPGRFCWACGRPTREDGLSGKGHKGVGKPCPACGFKRKMHLTQKRLDGLKKGQVLLQDAYANGHRGTDAWNHVKEIAPRDGIAELKREERMLKRGRDSVPSLTELMRMKAEDRAEHIMAPYFAALALQPKEDWSPSTKLEFYNGQTAIGEKVLNRLEGLPVARHRHVDKDDEDVIPEGELSPRVVAKLVANILADTPPEELIEDAEFSEVPGEAP
jgi:hypothetical protein